MGTETCTIQALCGLASLTGIDKTKDTMEPDSYRDGEEIEVCRFCLDGVVYEFSENPCDGYRSDHIGPDVVSTAMRNTFKPIQVVCLHITRQESYEADMLLMINAKNGKTILEVGTNNADDYYPFWVCNFSAEAIGSLEETEAK